MMHRYIRSKTNTKEILASGYVDAGGLGEFDSERFEEVEGDLPEQWTRADAADVSDPFVAVLNQLTNPDDQLAVLRLRALYEQAVLLRLPVARQAIETQLALLAMPPVNDEVEVN